MAQNLSWTAQFLLFWAYQKWHFQSPNWKWMVSGWGEVQSSLLTVRTNVAIRSLILSALHHHPSVAQAKLINIWFNICQNCNNSKTFPGVSLETTQGLCTYVFAIIYLLTPYNHHPTPPHYWRGICEPLLMSLDNVEIMSCGEKIILNTNIVKLVKLNISLLFLRNKFSQRSGLWKPKLHLLSSEDSRENVQPYYQLWWL